MIISENLVRLRREEETSISDFCKETRDVYDELNIFEKIKINRLERLIFEIATKIERDSGWIYMPQSFVLKSDYSYDHETKEIDYRINKVDIGDEVKKETSSKYEYDFYTKYKELLTKLAQIIQKRQAIISAHTLKIPSTVIDFTRRREDRIWNDGLDREMAYINDITRNFMIDYGMEGVNKLVDLLNDLVDSSDLVKTYNNQFKGNMSIIYVRELYFWASAFSSRARYTIDLIDEQQRKDQEMLKIF